LPEASDDSSSSEESDESSDSENDSEEAELESESSEVENEESKNTSSHKMQIVPKISGRARGRPRKAELSVESTPKLAGSKRRHPDGSAQKDFSSS